MLVNGAAGSRQTHPHKKTRIYLMHTEVNNQYYHLSFQVFSFEFDPVRNIHPDAFRGLLVLKRLILRSTQLLKLPSMQHIGHSLTNLDISRSRKFKGNHTRDFNYLRKIKYITMAHNRLKGLPLGLNHLANTVKALDFSSNAIKSIASLEGVNFVRLQSLYLRDNDITHLRLEMFTTPNLQRLNLIGNDLVSLDELNQLSWGSSSPKHSYLAIDLPRGTWHCNGSLIWMHSNLYELAPGIVYAKPSLKTYIPNVHMLVCKSPETRRGTAVPRDAIGNVITISSLLDLV